MVLLPFLVWPDGGGIAPKYASRPYE